MSASSVEKISLIYRTTLKRDSANLFMVEKVFPHADLIDVRNYILFCIKSRWNDVIIRACRFTNLSAISPFTIKRDLTTQILCLHQAHKFLTYYIVCVLNWYIYIYLREVSTHWAEIKKKLTTNCSVIKVGPLSEEKS